MAQTAVGTPLYVAPEVVKGMPYDSRADVWSMGCTFYEILTLTPPFTGLSMSDLMCRVKAGVFQRIDNHFEFALCSSFPNFLAVIFGRSFTRCWRSIRGRSLHLSPHIQKTTHHRRHSNAALPSLSTTPILPTIRPDTLSIHNPLRRHAVPGSFRFLRKELLGLQTHPRFFQHIAH